MEGILHPRYLGMFLQCILCVLLVLQSCLRRILLSAHFVEAERYGETAQPHESFQAGEFRRPETPNVVMEHILLYPSLFSLVLDGGRRSRRTS